jgi:F0F1-type ATP synthase assembly protein I
VTQPPPNSREVGYYFALAQVGTEMVVPLVIGAIIDHYAGWTPWATVIGLVLGSVGGMVHLILMVKRHDAEKRRQRPGGTP